jgi:hypothetical protein
MEAESAKDLLTTMKTVGILTYHFVNNYGAMLQAASLQKAFSSLGASPFFINYQPDHVEKGLEFRLPFSREAIVANAKTLYLAIQRIRNKEADANNRPRFESFAASHLNVQPQVYKSIIDLRCQPPQADLYVCGSDQIWNKSQQFGFDPAYFLGFGPETIPRASYAASFGRASFKESDYTLLRDLLEPMSFISVREESGCRIVRQATGRDSVCVPDPTILLDDVRCFAGPVPSHRPYVFVYLLRQGSLARQLQKTVTKELGLGVRTPGDPIDSGNEADKVGVGPAEWIGMIQHADCVLTNSYHGTIVSILLGRPFLTVSLSGRKEAYNERSRHLLAKLGLLDRIIGESEASEVVKKMQEPINWAYVNGKLATMKAEGMKALETVLVS